MNGKAHDGWDQAAEAAKEPGAGPGEPEVGAEQPDTAEGTTHPDTAAEDAAETGDPVKPVEPEKAESASHNGQDSVPERPTLGVGVAVAAPPVFAALPPRPYAPGAVVLAAVGVGLAGAFALPLDRPGIGWGLVGLVLAAAVWLVARRDGEVELRAGERVLRLGWGLLAIGLLAVGAVRDASWLFTLCVLGAGVAGSLAAGGGKSFFSLFAGAFSVPITALVRLDWVIRGAAALRVRGTRGRMLVSVVVSVVLLLVFGALFAGADASFAALVSAVLPTVDGPAFVRGGFVFWVLLFGTAGACLVAVKGAPKAAERSARTIGLAEWALPVAVLVLLFGGFVAVQIAALFGGDQYVRQTVGLTYAQYARGGFWQLSAVSVLTLAVIGLATRWAPKDTGAQRLWLRVLLGALSVLTLVIVASSISRILTYQEVYGATVLRLLVLTCELWIGFVYLVVLAAGVRLRGSWVPRIMVTSALTVLFGLAVANPERIVAEGNMAKVSRLDAWYLAEMSADAVPVLDGLPEPMRSCVLGPISRNLTADPSWRDWNAARSSARELLARRPLAPLGDCDSRGLPRPY
ncbi:MULTISPECIES: DUF4153 domain-containing protein [unclassified Crossiella]|uniref:DUF4153 domain-containing protein n=1 Tax=unclassified Crossiella TaxID=2620835 RepID=UPI0020004E32|nr:MULTISPECIES: DUF4173 domain-containing protein [unclassified Crossiella]MCK2245349.1 DUF4173 domain-containing protein [Crossiella sp. S99.2]MCK2258949.1 DUF4173 domain-containing protein [Crossiella sp. S99.1]